MWPTSARWPETIRGTAGLELNVDAYRGGLLLRRGLPVEPSGASVTVDGGSAVRRTCRLTIADPSLRPVYWTDLLAPAGTELVVTAGLHYPDETTELVPVGVFRVTEPATEFGNLVVVTGADRSSVVNDDAFLVPWATNTSGTVVGEIERLIVGSLPTALVVDRTGDTSLCPPITWEQDTSPWAAALELALSIGADLAPDASGVFVIRPQPTPSDPAVWTAMVGESGIIAAGAERMTREGVYNAWTARNDAADGTVPVHATVFDLDPDSPTYWNGPFGHRPKSFSSPALNTTAKCQAAAQTKLTKSTAPARLVTAQVIPNHAVDYGDVALTLLADGTAETHMVQSFTLPLGVTDLMDAAFVSNIPAALPGPVVPPGSADITTYTPHSSIPTQSVYGVTVNGKNSFVYSTYDEPTAFQPHWGKFTTFSMGAGSANIQIVTNFDVTSVVVRPTIQAVAATIIDKRTVNLIISRPGNYSVEFNGNPAQWDQTQPGSTDQLDPLFIFASPPETNKPLPTDADVYAYFAEGGVYTGSSVVPGNGTTITIPASGDLVVPSNKKVYIEGGAVFKGRLILGATGAATGTPGTGITVDGRGIVDASWQSTPGNWLKVYRCDTTTVSNVIGLSCNKWAARVFGATGGVTVTGVRCFSWADKAKTGTPTPDGWDIIASTGVTLDGLFVRARDDGICFKNNKSSTDGNWAGDCHDNLVENFTVWNGDAGNGLEVGYEMGPTPYKMYNITFQHGTIIHKTTNPANTDVAVNFSRAAISCHNQGSAGDVSHITWDDIVIEDVIADNGVLTAGADGFIYVNSSAGLGTIQTDNLYFRDISVIYPQQTLGIQVRGGDSTHRVTNVTFENLVINGVVISDNTIAAAHGFVSSNVTNVVFVPTQTGGPIGVTLTAVADAWVRNNGTQSGVEVYLRVKNSATASVQRRSFIRFDATAAGLTSCTSAILRLWHIGNDSGASTTIEAYECASDTWTEAAITWGNQPAMGALLASVAVATQQQYFDFDVTAWVNAQLGGDKKISVVLWGPASDNQITFNSREASANNPQLVLTP